MTRITQPHDGTYQFAAIAQHGSLRSATGSPSVEVRDHTDIPGVLIGTDAADTLNGDEQSNVMVGLDGDDRLHGGNGADVLIGGPGNDSLIGGDGADVFAFALPVVEDGAVPSFGDDVIYDFNAGEGDTLDFGRLHDHFPDLSVSVRPTEDGDILSAAICTQTTDLTTFLSVCPARILDFLPAVLAATNGFQSRPPW